ncbi:hypothetical protein ACWDD9_43235 [Kitasatospora sp. NPDC001119]
MNDVRGWVERKLLDKGFSSSRLQSFQLNIVRSDYPNARALCVGLDAGQVFGVEDVDASVAAIPDVGFIVVVPTRIAHAAYERAEERGICVAGFGELLDALREDAEINRHVDSQEQYERRRLSRHKAVKSLKRKGHHAYEIQRAGLRPLVIATTNSYEFTADGLYSLLESYDGITLDLIVVTNPNCRGFSTESMQAAAHVGTPVVLLSDFLEDLGTKWT